MIKSLADLLGPLQSTFPFPKPPIHTHIAASFPPCRCTVISSPIELTSRPISLEQSIKDDIAVIKSSPFIGKELAEHCWGVVYDWKTGRLESVES
jgi:hypothetical protein